MQDLINYLQSLPPGKIDVQDEQNILPLLAECWDEIPGSNATNMHVSKLHRIYDLEWNPPVLTFYIERHASFCKGGSRAEIIVWSIDIEKKEAFCGQNGYRQMEPRQPPLNIKPIAKEIFNLIIKQKKDERLKWDKDGCVRLDIDKIIPSKDQYKATINPRRKRFRAELESLLSSKNWYRVRANKYSPNPVIETDSNSEREKR
jgi:hypothetical protein